MADALGSGPSGVTSMQVQLLLSAPTIHNEKSYLYQNANRFVEEWYE